MAPENSTSKKLKELTAFNNAKTPKPGVHVTGQSSRLQQKKA